MPTQLSEAPGKSPHQPLDVFVPYTVYLKFIQVRGKRFESIRDFEKEADRIETALDSVCDPGVDFDYTKPIAFTPQFGNKTARFSIHGNACKRSEFTAKPVGDRIVINTGEFKTGSAASRGPNRVPDTDLDDLAIELKTVFEAATGLVAIRVEVAGFIYGDGGSTFPI